MAGRTWLQHATPVTLGMKIAGWLGAMTRHRQRLAELRPRLLCLQFGGASGSLAALGEQAWPVSEALAGELGLNLPDQPWHTQRDRLVEFASLLGLIAGSLGKLGRDLALLMQTDVGEVFEPAAPGKGGSSTMPHKRNPVGCAVMIAAATRRGWWLPCCRRCRRNTSAASVSGTPNGKPCRNSVAWFPAP